MKTSSILAVLTAATFQEFFQEYFFDAWDFALFLVIMVIVDTITGIWAAYQRGELSSSPMGKVFTKLILYALVLIVLHGLESFPKDDMTKTIFSYSTSVGFAALIGREALSVIENIAKIKPDLLPPWIRKRLKQFNDTGNFNN